MIPFNLHIYENGVESCRFVKYAGSRFEISLSVPEETVRSVKLYCGNDTAVLESRDLAMSEDGRYTARFDFDEAGLYFFHFEAETDRGRVFISPDGATGVFTTEWQLLVVNNQYPTQFGFEGGIIYHIFVDRFRKAGNIPCRDDAIINPDWDNGVPEYAEENGGFLKNNTFFGGNLYGIIEKLDYIRDLGTDCLYLSPIFKAYSNHKYDTGDYLQVDEMFGGDAALEKLIFECKKRNIKLILDGVFNHVGDDSVYFNAYGKYASPGAVQSADSPYREWFEFNHDGGYECWWGITNLPKVKKTASFRRFICDTVIPKYMKMGIDGWRLDVVDEYSNDFLEEIVASTKKYNRNAFIIGEVWEDASNKTAYGERKSYLCGRSLDSVMNYPFRNGVIDFVKNADHTLLKETVTQINSHYPKEKLDNLMNMLGTHDTERILTVLGGASGDGKTNSELVNTKMTCDQMEKAVLLFKLAYTVLAVLPGKTAVYYGDEAGMEGYHDPFNRRPFPWGRENRELTDYIKKINLAKKNSMILTYGETQIPESPHDIFIICRYIGATKLFCVANRSGESYVLPFKAISLLDKTAVESVKPDTAVIVVPMTDSRELLSF